jgi:hypothetical protein
MGAMHKKVVKQVAIPQKRAHSVFVGRGDEALALTPPPEGGTQECTMIKRLKKNVAPQTVAVETPVVETPHNVVADVAEAAGLPEPIPAEAVAPVEAKAKKARYAPTSVLVDTAIITKVKDNPKRAGSKAWDRYNRFHKEGQTVAEYIAANKAANLSGMLARNDLRWDLEHGHIEIGQPVAPATESQEG